MKPTVKQSLFIVTGASGVGKTTLCEELFRKEKDYIVMESDIIWNDFYDTPENNYRMFRKICAGYMAHLWKAIFMISRSARNLPAETERR